MNSQALGTAASYRVLVNFGFESVCEHVETFERAVYKTLRSGVRPAAGDLVTVEGGVIRRILPRKNCIRRLRPGKREAEIAANIDVLGIVISCEPEASWRFIDTWLLVAWMEKVTPLLLLNKMDLDRFSAWQEGVQQRYRGYSLWLGSSFEGKGIARLGDLLAARLTLFVGLSGVGKSSLGNVLIPGLRLKAQQISNWSKKGRHTTSHTMLHPFGPNNQSGVIDSPGVRDIVISIPEDISPAWPEFRPFLGQCRFRSCRHQREPGCAVRQAVTERSIHASRYNSYLAIKERGIVALNTPG